MRRRPPTGCLPGHPPDGLPPFLGVRFCRVPKPRPPITRPPRPPVSRGLPAWPAPSTPTPPSAPAPRAARPRGAGPTRERAGQDQAPPARNCRAYCRGCQGGLRKSLYFQPVAKGAASFASWKLAVRVRSAPLRNHHAQSRTSPHHRGSCAAHRTTLRRARLPHRNALTARSASRSMSIPPAPSHGAPGGEHVRRGPPRRAAAGAM